MRKIIHSIVIVISILMVLLGLTIDIMPNISISIKAKLFFYVLPMIFLFVDMIYQIKKTEDEEQKKQIRRKMLTLIFIIYIIAIATFLFLGNEYRHLGSWENKISLFSAENIQQNVNFIPFRSIGTYISRLMEHTINTDIVITNLAGNLIVFAPFGFFIPLLFKDKIKNIGVFTIVMTVIIVIVELIQFLTRVGQADIDDVILNLLGAVITYLIVTVKPIRKKIERLLI